ncbi:MAG: hypothetical protein ABI656_09940 [bacterium]
MAVPLSYCFDKFAAFNTTPFAASQFRDAHHLSWRKSGPTCRSNVCAASVYLAMPPYAHAFYQNQRRASHTKGD